MPATIKATEAPKREGSRYPKPYDEACQARVKYLMGNAFGLDQFGVNLVVLQPSAMSSQRHWHENEDEFIYIVEGTLVLVDDAGEHEMLPGMCAGFKAGNGNGHCLKNTSAKPATYLEVGTRMAKERVWYSDIDMMVTQVNQVGTYTKKDGSSF